MTGVILGWPMAKALRLGVVCGSLSVTALGGTEGFPKSLSEAVKHFSEE